jgi:hypothetical protein
VFFILVAQTCDAARLARLPVRLTMRDGTIHEGHPGTTLARDDDGLDDAGYEDRLEVHRTIVKLSDVEAITVGAARG